MAQEKTLRAAVEKAKEIDCKMNIAIVDAGTNLAAQQIREQRIHGIDRDTLLRFDRRRGQVRCEQDVLGVDHGGAVIAAVVCLLPPFQPRLSTQPGAARSNKKEHPEGGEPCLTVFWFVLTGV